MQFHYYDLCLTVSSLRLATVTKQHFKDTTVLQMNCMLFVQMFVHVGGITTLCCEQCWLITQKS